MRALIAYLSYSGNTEETAEYILEKLSSHGVMVDMHRIGIDSPVNPSHYDVMFLGTFTWEDGRTPDEVKEFVLEIGYKPDNIAIFGTGDTQFGYFCGAVDKLTTFYRSRWQGLKIEQSPRGSQEHLIDHWLKGVLQHEANIA
ncbi:flavodoxin [Ornithinibacillus californiensis]|uniref:flavodoxin n=1 Tax=Ornithinibacillus californiensis TaxID=161536 RepID=UPI000A4C8AA9|nr:flavodoxin [Ornithinibacillus californiensis]